MINIDSLKGLVTSEHGDKLNYMSFISAMLLPLKNVSDLNHTMSTYLNLDKVVGKGLDLIGQILGLSRQLPFQPVENSSILDDDYYRLVLKAKIAKNQWRGTKEGLYELWGNLFPENPLLIVDNQNMTCQVVVIGLNDRLSRELILADYIVPRPAGVRYDYGFTDKPIYAQDMNTEYLKGLDEGYWLDLSGGLDV